MVCFAVSTLIDLSNCCPETISYTVNPKSYMSVLINFYISYSLGEDSFGLGISNNSYELLLLIIWANGHIKRTWFDDCKMIILALVTFWCATGGFRLCIYLIA